MSNGLRGTARKASGRPSAQRVPVEQLREMDEKMRMEDEERRSRGESINNRDWEEKENITDVEGDVVRKDPHQQNKQQRPSGPSPRGISSRSASTSQLDRPTSALPSRASTSRAPLQATGRQILPGPSRVGRILMGTKYANPAAGSTGFDKISEVDAHDTNLGGGGDFYGGDETDTGMLDVSMLDLDLLNIPSGDVLRCG